MKLVQYPAPEQKTINHLQYYWDTFNLFHRFNIAAGNFSRRNLISTFSP